MSCSHEHEDHGHGHDHEHHHDGHDHSDDVAPALQNSLYEKIRFDHITTLNEAVSGSGADVVRKSWNERLSTELSLNSDADEQLLMHVPFDGQVKLYSILIRTSDSENAPMTLKIFSNKGGLDFPEATDLPATQELALARTSEIQEIPLKRALFNAVRDVSLFFVDNHSQGDADVSTVYYVGFKGEWMKLSREPVNFLYEIAANPADHKKIPGVEGNIHSNIGGGR